MHKSNLIGRENRLIYRNLSDFGQVAPVNARAAEEAAKLQNSNRQTERYVNPNADLVERMVQTNFDYSKATPQEIARHEEGLRLADVGPADRGTNPAKGVMTDQQNVYANKAAGLNTTFTSQTGASIYDQQGTTQASGQGVIDQSLVDRLRRNGMPDSQIREVLKDPIRLAEIQKTMSNTGLTTIDPKTEARNNEIASIPTTIEIISGYGENGQAIRQTITNPNYASDVAGIKNRFAQEDNAAAVTRSTNIGEQGGRAASDIATQNTNQVTTSGDPLTDAINNNVKGLPGGDIYSAQLQASETQKTKDIAAAEAQKKLGLMDAETAKANSDKLLQGVEKRREDLFKQAREDANKTQEETNTMLADREASQKEQLNWQKDRDTQKLEKDKTDQVLQQSIQLALRGGYGSGAGTEKIANTERQWDIAITDLQKAYAFKESDISSEYTSLYVASNKAHRDDLRLATQDYTDALDAIDQTYYANDTAYKQAQNKVLSDYVASVNKANNDSITRTDGIITNIQTAISDKADNEREDRKNIMEEWNNHISTYGNTNKTGADNIISRMSKMGMDTIGLNADAPTLAQSEKQAKDMAKNLISDNIGKYIDETSGLDLVSVLDSSTRDLTVGRVDSVVNSGIQYLKDGNITAFKSLILSNARSGMDTDTAKKVKMSEGFIRQMDSLEGMINQMSPDDFGWWKSVIEKGKTYAEIEKDDRFTEIKSAIEYSQSQIRNMLFGAALSPQEAELANNFLTDFSTDEMGTIVTKLNTLRNSLNITAEVSYDYQLGEGAYKNYVLGDGTKLGDLPDTPVYTGAAASEYFNGGSSSSSSSSTQSSTSSSGSFGAKLSALGRQTQGYDTPIASKENGGLYAQSTVNAWEGKHAGLDLAVPQGTGFESLIDGEIVEFGYQDGWGGTVVIRDPKGGEHRISHLSELSPELKKGAKISLGQPLAKTGGAKGTRGAGNSTGAHVDYRIRYKGQYVDPLTYSPA